MTGSAFSYGLLLGIPSCVFLHSSSALNSNGQKAATDHTKRSSPSNVYYRDQSDDNRLDVYKRVDLLSVATI